MRRREIKQLFEQMALTYYPSTDPKNERWKIPNEDLTIRIVLSYITSDIESGTFNSNIPMKTDAHWSIKINGRLRTELYTPEEGIKFIQDIIYNQFERQFIKFPWYEEGYMKDLWTVSSYMPLLLPEAPKPTHFKPVQHVCKTQRYQNRPRFNRLSYPKGR